MSLTNFLPACVVVATVAVIALTDLIKKLDVKNILKHFTACIPAVLSCGISFLLGYGQFFDFHQVWFWWAVIYALSVFFYDAVIKKMHEWIEKNKEE